MKCPRNDAQLTYSPRPFGEREQALLSRKAKFTDAGEGLILKYILNCHGAQIVGLSTNPNIYPRNDARFVVSLTNLIHLPPQLRHFRSKPANLQ